MRYQEPKFRASGGSSSGSYRLSGGSSSFQFQSGSGSSSLNVGQLRGGAKETSSGGGDGGGSSSLGFILVNCLVLGVVGYTFMTDDTSATTDATGGFSFFKSENENSFAVKPGARAADRGTRFDWSGKRARSDIANHKLFASLEGFSFGSDGRTKSPSGTATLGAFLVPGQLEELVSTVPSIILAGNGHRSYRPMIGHGAPGSESGRNVFQTTLPTVATYQRYSVATLQEPQTSAERNTMAVENAANGGQVNAFRILKGRLKRVAGQGRQNGVLDVFVSYGPKGDVSKVSLAGIENGRARATEYSIPWSSELASSFYALEPGFTDNLSTRVQVLATRTVMPPAEHCSPACREIPTDEVSKRLSGIADNRNIVVYVVEDPSADARQAAKALLLQDLAERKWQVIRLEPVAG